MPRHSGDEARDSFQGEAQYLLAGARCWQMNPDHGFHLDNARRDLDQSQAQRVELCYAPLGAARH